MRILVVADIHGNQVAAEAVRILKYAAQGA
jgi:predicted phosphodiesterase